MMAEFRPSFFVRLGIVEVALAERRVDRPLKVEALEGEFWRLEVGVVTKLDAAESVESLPYRVSRDCDTSESEDGSESTIGLCHDGSEVPNNQSGTSPCPAIAKTAVVSDWELVE